MVGGGSLLALQLLSNLEGRLVPAICTAPFSLSILVASLACTLGSEKDVSNILRLLTQAALYAAATTVLLLLWAVACRAFLARDAARPARAVLGGGLLAGAAWLLVVCCIFRNVAAA